MSSPAAAAAAAAVAAAGGCRADQLLPKAVEGGWHRDKQLRVAAVAVGHTHAVLLATQVPRGGGGGGGGSGGSGAAD